jgi:hypothetical protein
MLIKNIVALLASRLLALLAAAACITVSAHAAPVFMVGESLSVSVGDTLEVPILVSGAFDLKSFQFDLAYDETKLQLLAFTDAGTAFEQAAVAAGGSLLGITGFQLPGLLSGAADSMIGVFDGMAGSGSVAYIEFRALSAGNSALTLSSVYLDGIELASDAIVNGRADVPEPSSMALLGVAIAILVAVQFTIRVRSRGRDSSTRATAPLSATWRNS